MATKRQRGRRGAGDLGQVAESAVGHDGSAIFTESEWMELGERLHMNGRMLGVVRAIFDDKTEYAMAQDMGISEHSVHTYVERVRRHLGVHSRVKIVLSVMELWRTGREKPGGELAGDGVAAPAG